MPQAVIKGQTNWFKAIGEPRENKFKGNAREWSFQIAVGSAEKLLFRQNKVKKSIKFSEELGDYVQLDWPEKDKKGNLNKPIKVVDAEGVDWPQDKWVGNGSEIEAHVTIDPYSFTNAEGEKISGAKLIPTKIIITKHVPYESKNSKTSATKEKRVDKENWTEDAD
jgi:hypothetical protein